MQINWFTNPNLSKVNLLPANGEVYYLGCVFEKMMSDEIFNKLMNEISWEQDRVKIFGRIIETKRKVAWYGDEPYVYKYSNIVKTAILWNETLRKIKLKTEQITNDTYNSCLLNLYHNGSEAMSWHCDDEPELKKHGAIASLSFGAERKFCFKHKFTKETISLNLENGSLLLMKGETQNFWFHRLPPSKKILEPRINLTFRSIEQKPLSTV